MQIEKTQPLNEEKPVAQPLQEIIHVPLWVKGLLICGVILFAVELPGFGRSLSDAIQKSRAEKAYASAQYSLAIDGYKELHRRYPSDRNLVKYLGFAYYRAGLYAESLETFDLLAGMKMPKREANEINSAISDIAAKLNLKTKEPLNNPE